MLDQNLAFFPRNFARLCGGEKSFEIAPSLQQVDRALGADRDHSRDIIRAIPNQREIIADLIGTNTEFFFDLGRSVSLFLKRVEDLDPPVHQLHQILVTAYDHHLVRRIALGPIFGQGSDQIVCFNTLLPKGR